MNIPYSFLPQKLSRKLASKLLFLTKPLEKIFPYLTITLKQARFNITAKEYMAMCLFSNIFLFAVFLFFSNIFVSSLEVSNPFLVSFFISFCIFIFIWLQQVNYPKMITLKRIKQL